MFKYNTSCITVIGVNRVGDLGAKLIPPYKHFLRLFKLIQYYYGRALPQNLKRYCGLLPDCNSLNE